MSDSLRRRPSTSSLVSTNTSSDTLRKFHRFATYSFTKPTYCDLCSNFIWGLVNQGEQCSCILSNVACGYNVHHRCQYLVRSPCNPVKHFSVHGRYSKSSSSLLLDTPPPSPKLGTLGKPGLVTELFAATQSEAKKLDRVFDDANPPLSLSTMLKNNNRFVPRQAPFIWLNKTLVQLVTWQNPANTLLFMAIYIIVCTNPWIIPVLPQLVILYLTARFYHFRAELIMSNQPLPAPHVLGTPPKIPMTNEKTLAHLKQIQNTMAQVCDAYDAGYNLYKMMDWSSPDQTLLLLQGTAASMVATWLLLYLVPWNYILLFAGLGVFIANTAIFRAASLTLTPALIDNLQKRIQQAKQALQASRIVGEQNINKVEVFENQRWWAGTGFVPFLLTQERQAWSDSTGLLSLPPKDLYDVPECNVPGKQWEWLDEDWELDYKWTQVDDAGWTYTNQQWENAKPKSGMGMYTRRRKWTRNMKLVSVEGEMID